MKKTNKQRRIEEALYQKVKGTKSQAQIQREAIKKRDKETGYGEYSRTYDFMKRKGYVFKKGAEKKYTFKEYEADRVISELKLEEINRNREVYNFSHEDQLPLLTYPAFMAADQLQTQDESIEQATYLWNNIDACLAFSGGPITSLEFRENERNYFRILRSQYPNEESYDAAMSY